jgi:hypothetical protein
MANMLSKIYEGLCEKMLNTYICFWSSLGYTITPKKEADSFIITENGIEIINLTKETDRVNLIKYLKHHIMYTDDKFHPMYFFDGPLIVRFKYQNETYQVCLKQLESKNTDHSVSIKEPKILSAVVKLNEDDEGKCVTEQLVEFHGPNRNFFSHIPDTVADFSMILKDHRGELHTFDMMGNKNIHKL